MVPVVGRRWSTALLAVLAMATSTLLVAASVQYNDSLAVAPAPMIMWSSNATVTAEVNLAYGYFLPSRKTPVVANVGLYSTAAVNAYTGAAVWSTPEVNISEDDYISIRISYNLLRTTSSRHDGYLIIGGAQSRNVVVHAGTGAIVSEWPNALFWTGAPVFSEAASNVSYVAGARVANETTLWTVNHSTGNVTHFVDVSAPPAFTFARQFPPAAVSIDGTAAKLIVAIPMSPSGVAAYTAADGSPAWTALNGLHGNENVSVRSPLVPYGARSFFVVGLSNASDDYSVVLIQLDGVSGAVLQKAPLQAWCRAPSPFGMMLNGLSTHFLVPNIYVNGSTGRFTVSIDCHDTTVAFDADNVLRLPRWFIEKQTDSTTTIVPDDDASYFTTPDGWVSAERISTGVLLWQRNESMWYVPVSYRDQGVDEAERMAIFFDGESTVLGVEPTTGKALFTTYSSYLRMTQVPMVVELNAAGRVIICPTTSEEQLVAVQATFNQTESRLPFNAQVIPAYAFAAVPPPVVPVWLPTDASRMYYIDGTFVTSAETSVTGNTAEGSMSWRLNGLTRPMVVSLNAPDGHVVVVVQPSQAQTSITLLSLADGSSIGIVDMSDLLVSVSSVTACSATPADDWSNTFVIFGATDDGNSDSDEGSAGALMLVYNVSRQQGGARLIYQRAAVPLDCVGSDCPIACSCGVVTTNRAVYPFTLGPTQRVGSSLLTPWAAPSAVLLLTRWGVWTSAEDGTLSLMDVAGTTRLASNPDSASYMFSCGGDLVCYQSADDSVIRFFNGSVSDLTLLDNVPVPALSAQATPAGVFLESVVATLDTVIFAFSSGAVVATSADLAMVAWNYCLTSPFFPAASVTVTVIGHHVFMQSSNLVVVLYAPFGTVLGAFPTNEWSGVAGGTYTDLRGHSRQVFGFLSSDVASVYQLSDTAVRPALPPKCPADWGQDRPTTGGGGNPHSSALVTGLAVVGGVGAGSGGFFLIRTLLRRMRRNRYSATSVGYSSADADASSYKSLN